MEIVKINVEFMLEKMSRYNLLNSLDKSLKCSEIRAWFDVLSDGILALSRFRGVMKSTVKTFIVNDIGVVSSVDRFDW